jgi:erythromycin esterase-like protein
MWRNHEVADFVAWLRAHNDSAEAVAGFYGIDLYSLHGSIAAVLDYLATTDDDAYELARRRYACFGGAGDPQEYAYRAGFGRGQSCEDEAVATLLDLQERQAPDDSGLFSAVENARLVVDAERYYRLMFRGDVSSWNLRDRHMMDVVCAVDERLSQDKPARLVVWAHNSHLGDARATEMGRHGEWNVGQLARERYGEEVFNLGFTSYDGTVTAASDWGEEEELKRVRPARPDSYEHLLHEASGGRNVWLPTSRALPAQRLERAIGVIYRPETERASHYFDADLAAQFDYVIHCDHTHGVEPLEPGERWQGGEVPETYPFAV